MPNSELSEIYFITGMMVLILIICTVSTYFFFKTFYKEKAMREKEREEKQRQKAPKVEASKQ